MFTSPPKHRRQRELKLRLKHKYTSIAMKEIIKIKRTSFSNQTLNSTVKSIGRQKTVFRKAWKQLTSIQLQTIQNVAEGKTNFSNPNSPR